MDKKKSIELISKEIRQDLTTSANPKIKLKMKLIPLINKVKTLHKINFEISLNEIIEQLNKDNEKHHSNIEIFIKNQIHFIYLKKSDIIIEPVEDKDNNTKFLLENHFFSVITLFFLLYILDIINNILIVNRVYFFGINLAYLITFFIIAIFYKFNKNFKTLFFCFSSIVFLNFENGFIASIISMFITILFLNNINSKNNIFIIPITFVIFLIFSVLGIFIHEQITISSSIINNILIISIIITMFFAYNNYNLLGYIFFIATSLTLYHILCDVIIFLNERMVIFYPYNDKLHIEIYLFSFSLTMLFFTLDVFKILVEQLTQISKNIYLKLKEHIFSSITLITILTIFIYTLLKFYIVRKGYIDSESDIILASFMTSIIGSIFIISIILLTIPSIYKNNFKNENINRFIKTLVNIRKNITINYKYKSPQEKIEKDSNYNQYFKIYGKLNNENLFQNILILTVIYVLILSNSLYGNPESHFYKNIQKECNNISENTYISKINKENKILTLNYKLKDLKIKYQYINKLNKNVYIYEEDCNKVNKIN